MKQFKLYEVITYFVISSVIVLVILILIIFIVPTSFIWVMDKGDVVGGTNLVKMCENGNIISKIQFGQSGAIGVDPIDGSVWAPELNDPERNNANQIVKIDHLGNVIMRINDYRAANIAVDPNDGSVWVGLPNEDQIVKLNRNGDLILRTKGVFAPYSLTVDPSDSSVWIADAGHHPNPRKIAHFSADGVLIFEMDTPGFFSNAPHQIAINYQDGSVWFTGFHSGQVFKYSSDGKLEFRQYGFDRPISIAIDQNSGDAWIANFSVENEGAIVKISSDGNEINDVKLKFPPKLVEQLFSDNLVRVGVESAVGKTSSYASEIIDVKLISPPKLIGYNPFDNSIWVGVEGAMINLSLSGEIIKIITGFNDPNSIAFIDIETDIKSKVLCFIPPWFQN